MKRKIVVEIDCGDNHCGFCALNNHDWDYCQAYDNTGELDRDAQDWKRNHACLGAEKEYKILETSAIAFCEVDKLADEIKNSLISKTSTDPPAEGDAVKSRAGTIAMTTRGPALIDNNGWHFFEDK